MKRLLLLLAGVFLFAGFSYGKEPAYSIKGKVNGIKDTAVYLGYHYGDKQYLKDTAKVDAAGKFVFEGDKKLDGGIYLVVLPAKNYFEIVIGDEQNFSFETDTADLMMNFKSKGSLENELYYDYQRFMIPRGREIDKLRKEYDSQKDNKEAAEKIRKRMAEIDKERTDYMKNVIAKHPQTFVAKFFKAMLEIEIPDPPVLPDGKVDSLFRYRYYKAHYWDNIDFTDDRILRTPIYHNKLKQFMESVIVQIPDSVSKEADALLLKAKDNPELFKYTTWFITNSVEKSKIMGMDAAFVHMVENYYQKGLATWVDSTTLAKMSDRAAKIKPTIIGTTAHNIAPRDTTGKILALHSVKAPYTILYFWDHECGHCKKITPEILKIYQKYRGKGVKAYAVNTQYEVDAWKKYVRENKLDWINVMDMYNQTRFRDYYDIYSTPVIYLLDENKKIIAKRLSHEQVDEILEKKFKDAAQ